MNIIFSYRTYFRAFFGPGSHLFELAVEGTHLCIVHDTLALLHQLLSLKNVFLLQQVFQLLMERYEHALVTLAEDVKPFLAHNAYTPGRVTKLAAKKTAMFVLATLSGIATTKGSVLSMWALEPGIFNVLAEHSGMMIMNQPYFSF